MLKADLYRLKVELYGTENGYATLTIKDKNGYFFHHKNRRGNDTVMYTLKMYFREEKTWNDHMGNTPCGYYVILPVYGKRIRYYLYS